MSDLLTCAHRDAVRREELTRKALGAGLTFREHAELMALTPEAATSTTLVFWGPEGRIVVPAPAAPESGRE